MREVRGAEIAMIFQEPMTSLNPVFTVGEQVAEPLVCTSGMSKKEARAEATELFRLVGIPIPSGASTTIRTRCRAACASA